MESKRVKQQKKKQRRLLLLLLLLVCSGVLFGTTTYAWFTANKTVTVDPIDVNVEAKSGLQISADGETWKSVISNADLKGASSRYSAAVNQIPSMIEPVSTVGEVNENGKMKMFLGEVSTNDTGEWLLSSTESVEENRTDAGSFVAFDIFLRTEKAGQIYLTTNSGVEFTDAADNGIKNATRIAFVVLGNTPSDSELGTIQGLNGGTSSPVTIWEPNAGSHTTYGVNNAKEVYGVDSLDAGKIDNAPVSYDGIKAEFDTGDNITIDDATATSHSDEFAAVNPAIKTNDGFTDYQALISLSRGITKVRVYMWIEGQDVDCENNASGGNIQFNLQMSTNSSADGA